MRSHTLRRIVGASAVLVTAAALAASCATSPKNPPAQPVYDWEARANTLHVVDDTNDNFACDTLNVNCDEPFLLHVAFRVQYGVENSASTWVVHGMPDEIRCVGAPPSSIVFGAQLADVDSCKSGESATVPEAMGVVRFDGLRATDIANLFYKQFPEIAGVITFAFEEDILSPSNPNTGQLEGLVADLLNDNIANEELTSTGGTAGGQQAADEIVTDLANLFGDLVSGPAITLISGVGLLDDFVGIAPVVIAGVQGGLADLVNLAGLQSVPVLNGRVFTTAADSSFSATYTAQTIEIPGDSGLEPITIGDENAQYDIDWTVGRPAVTP